MTEGPIFSDLFFIKLSVIVTINRMQIETFLLVFAKPLIPRKDCLITRTD